MKATIIANATLQEGDLAKAQEADLLIAVNGGFSHCQRHDLQPAAVIGDLDSIEPEALERFHGHVIRYPRDKDQTDLELALRYAVEQGATQIDILAALGNRWDQSVANVLLLTTLDIPARLIEGDQELFVITPERPAEVEAPAGSRVSLLPLTSSVLGVNSHGLRYTLDSDLLDFGKSRGVSNRLVSGRAMIQISRGKLLCVLIRKQGGSHAS